MAQWYIWSITKFGSCPEGLEHAHRLDVADWGRALYMKGKGTAWDASMAEARRAARIDAYANLHFHLMAGLPVPEFPVKIEKQFRTSRYSRPDVMEKWHVPGDGREAVRIYPKPMPAKGPAKPAAPKVKPVLVAAPDLKTAWDLVFLMDPGQAVGLIEQGRRVLRTGEATRLWFAEGFGPEALTLANLMAMVNPEGKWWHRGYKVKPGSKEALLRRLLRALGRSDWERAEAMIRKGQVRVQGYSRCKKSDGSTAIKETTHTNTNGRCLRINYPSMISRRDLGIFNLARIGNSRLGTYGFGSPADAPSVPALLEYRTRAAERMRLARTLLHSLWSRCGRECLPADEFHSIRESLERMPFPREF